MTEGVKKNFVIFDNESQKDMASAMDDASFKIASVIESKLQRKKKQSQSPERMIYPPGTSEQDVKELLKCPMSNIYTNTKRTGRNERTWSAVVSNNKNPVKLR